ncbi:MAG: Rrf2 family transcriptional regulator [Bacteroidales bacterium]
MNFSKTTEYALQILGFMSADENKLYSANELYENLKIPFRYLRKQLTLMTKNELLKSVQGKDGGYKILKNIGQLTLLNIIEATGDNIISNNCFFGYGNCALSEKCVMHDKWTAIQENINEVLSSTKLADLKNTINQNSIL